VKYRWSQDFPERNYFRVRCPECNHSLVPAVNCSSYAFEPFMHSCGTRVYEVGNVLIRTGRRTIHKARKIATVAA